MGGSIGAGWASELDQEGWNREATCYPDNACFDADPISQIPGYRWRYAVAAAAGARYESPWAAPAYVPPLAFYDSHQDEDLTDTVPAAHLHVGADYRLDDRTQLGLRLSYSMLGAIEDSGAYASHPWHAEDPKLRNHNMFTGARDWTLALTFKRRFDN